MKNLLVLLSLVSLSVSCARKNDGDSVGTATNENGGNSSAALISRQLNLSSAPTAITGQCVPLTVHSQDQNSVDFPVDADTVIDLSDTGGAGTFYSDSGCSTSTTQLTLPANSSSLLFYYKRNAVGSVSLQLQAPSLISAPVTLTFSVGAATQLAFSGATTLTTTFCAGYTIQAKDSGGNLAGVSTDTLVSLSNSADGIFYSNWGCTVQTSSVLIASGNNAQTVYFKKTTPGSVSITASATSLTAVTQSLTVGTSTASQLSLPAPTSTPTTDTCLPLSVQTLDAVGNPVPVTTARIVTLSGAGTGGTFYSNVNCSTSITSLTILANAGSQTFYYRKSSPGTVTLAATRTGMVSANQTVTVINGTATKLPFSTSVTPMAAGSCQAFAVRTLDQWNNTTNVTGPTQIDLSGEGSGGAFYSNSTCTASTTTLTLASGANTAGFWYKKTGAGSVTLSATASGLSAITKTVVVSSGLPIKLSFQSPISNAVRNSCVSFQIRTFDEQNLAVNAVSLVTVNLSDGSAGGGFYSASNCTAAITSTTIASGSNTKTIYYKYPTTGTVTVTASDASGALTLVTRSVLFSSGVAQSIAYSTAASSVNAGTCSTVFTIQTRDEAAQAANVSLATVVLLTGQGSDGNFYSNSTCSNLITSTTIGSGANTASFYYKKSSEGSLTFSAASTGYMTLTRAFTVNRVATQLVFSVAPAVIATDNCTAYTIEARSSTNITTNVSANAILTLGGVSSNGSFYLDDSCTAATSNTTILSGTSSVTIYYSQSDLSTTTLSASASGFTAASTSVTAE